MPRFVDVSDPAVARGVISAERAHLVNALDYGATGDGTTDDTAALQSWLDYVVANNAAGWLPNGTYKITSTLVAASSPTGYSIHGEHSYHTKISQATNNIAVLQIGDTDDSTRQATVENLTLTYATAQSSSNTSANCIVFQGPGAGQTTTAYGTFRRLIFLNGYYAMQVATGLVPPWGCEFDMLYMQDMSGGFYDNTGSVGGVPNNKWGRMTLYCDDCVGPIFKEWNTYNTTIGAIEFLRADSGAQLITAVAGFGADIGSIKLEIGTYTAAGSLIQLPSSHWLRIGDFRVDLGTNINPASGTFAAFSIPAVSDIASSIDIASMRLRATTLSGNCVGFNTGAGLGKIRLGSVELSNGWTLHERSTSTVGDHITVNSWVNRHLSQNKGDADYTVTLGDPNVVQFSTAFTAQRTITLPAQVSNNTCAGLYYDLIFDGAINGANTAVIKQSSSTIRTQTVDKKRLRYMWRRSAWVLVDIADLSAPTTTYTPTNVTTDRAFDADSTTTAELADVLGTLIADLKTKGIIA